jgi:predicted membrane metal-binding protein
MHDARRYTKEAKPGSERSFGLLFFVVFTVIALWPAIWGGSIRWWASFVALSFGVVALTATRLLIPFNRLWFRFGMLLHAVMSPAILCLIFVCVVVPTGLLLRMFGKDVLDIRDRRRQTSSYWIARENAPVSADSMKNQF